MSREAGRVPRDHGPDTAKTRTDRALLTLTVLCVGGLALVAAAISFAHMRELALHHGQPGWKALAFPVSVDGLEIVASLYLVAQRRAGRPTGWVPWVALVVGTAASLAANVAVGGDDPIGKALAGWPALSMLVSVKLLFAMIDHTSADERTAGTVPAVSAGTGDGHASSEPVPTVRETTAASSASRPADRAGLASSGRSATGRTGAPAAPIGMRDVAHLIPVARAARRTLASTGRSLSRDNLAAAMRRDGHRLSNARACLLLKIVKAEQDGTAIGNADERAGRKAACPSGPGFRAAKAGVGGADGRHGAPTTSESMPPEPPTAEEGAARTRSP